MLVTCRIVRYAADRAHCHAAERETGCGMDYLGSRSQVSRADLLSTALRPVAHVGLGSMLRDLTAAIAVALLGSPSSRDRRPVSGVGPPRRGQALGWSLRTSASLAVERSSSEPQRAALRPSVLLQTAPAR